MPAGCVVAVSSSNGLLSYAWPRRGKPMLCVVDEWSSDFNSLMFVRKLSFETRWARGPASQAFFVASNVQSCLFVSTERWQPSAKQRQQMNHFSASDPHRDIILLIFPFWHSAWHISWRSFLHSVWHIFCQSFAFYQIYLLTDYLSGIPSGISIWHSIWHIFWHPPFHILGSPTDIFFDNLSGILSGISSDILSGISPDIFSRISSDVKSGVQSDGWGQCITTPPTFYPKTNPQPVHARTPPPPVHPPFIQAPVHPRLDTAIHTRISHPSIFHPHPRCPSPFAPPSSYHAPPLPRAATTTHNHIPYTEVSLDLPLSLSVSCAVSQPVSESVSQSVTASSRCSVSMKTKKLSFPINVLTCFRKVPSPPYAVLLVSYS